MTPVKKLNIILYCMHSTIAILIRSSNINSTFTKRMLQALELQYMELNITLLEVFQQSYSSKYFGLGSVYGGTFYCDRHRIMINS